jgi:hypothetical protein
MEVHVLYLVIEWLQLIVEMDIQSDLWMTVYIIYHLHFTFYILYSYDWFCIYVHGFMEDTINWNWNWENMKHWNEGHKMNTCTPFVAQQISSPYRPWHLYSSHFNSCTIHCLSSYQLATFPARTHTHTHTHTHNLWCNLTRKSHGASNPVIKKVKWSGLTLPS